MPTWLLSALTLALSGLRTMPDDPAVLACHVSIVMDNGQTVTVIDAGCTCASPLVGYRPCGTTEFTDASSCFSWTEGVGTCTLPYEIPELCGNCVEVVVYCPGVCGPEICSTTVRCP